MDALKHGCMEGLKNRVRMGSGFGAVPEGHSTRSTSDHSGALCISAFGTPNGK